MTFSTSTFGQHRYISILVDMSTILSGGHTSSILSVAVTSPTARIISGGENGELCVWSPDGSTHQQVKLPPDDVTSICCSEINLQVIYVACGNKIIQLDLRQPGEFLHTYECNEEEVNQIALNEKEEFLASCNDTGNIKIINLRDKKVYKTLRKHSNICATVSFRPKRTWDLLSGGYDNMLLQWDFSRNRAYCSINMEDFGQPPEDVSSYLVSPPFVHSLCVSRDGSYVACGTENALVHVFDASKKNVSFGCTLRGHTQGVSQVHFPKFSNTCLLSGGNDGQVILWDVEVGCNNAPRLTNGSSQTSTHNAQQVDELPHGDITLPKYKIEHGAKVNWLASGESAGNQPFIVVADNSSSLTLYPFPEY